MSEEWKKVVLPWDCYKRNKHTCVECKGKDVKRASSSSSIIESLIWNAIREV